MLSIVCEPCNRRGRYTVATLIDEHGDAKLTDLLVILANCPKARSTGVYDRFRAVYERLGDRAASYSDVILRLARVTWESPI
jgi:hypothetical protein